MSAFSDPFAAWLAGLLALLDWQGWFTLTVVLGAFVLLARPRTAPDLVTAGALTALLISGVLTPAEALIGFSNPGMITIAVLYVVVTGLTETGAVHWLGQALLGRPRSEARAQLRLMAIAAGCSAFLNTKPVVAIFIPAVTDWARRQRLTLSRLLLPLSYAAIAGGSCTLVGTSTNLIVNGLYIARSDGPGLRLFDLTWVGLPVVLAVLVFMLTAGRWLLPARGSASASYREVRRYTSEMLIPAGSPLHGKSVETAGLRQLPGLFLVQIERPGRIIPAVSAQEILYAGDRLVFAGILDSVLDVQRTRGLVPATDQVFKLDGPRHDRCFVEVVLARRAPVVGRSVRAGRFRNRYGAVIIAVSRHGERIDRKLGDIVLARGDTLLLETRPEFVDQYRNSRDFLIVHPLGDAHPPIHERAPLALAIVVAMVASAAVGLFTLLEAAMLAAGAMLLTRCTSARVARQAPDWQVLIVIAASFGIAAALEQTGAAVLLSGALIELAGGAAWPALALFFCAVALVTAIATNSVAAVLMFPVAMDTAALVGASPLPFLMVLMIGASASFATPIGYQTNLMVYNIGGYRFGDFVRIGVPLTLVVGAVSVGLVPLVWPF
ncbi:MAG: SLC13 family permease [Chromatiaceae bacterium]|nr:MAG: SLC13 family permease [Chromatiaceae bacterium]